MIDENKVAYKETKEVTNYDFLNLIWGFENPAKFIINPHFEDYLPTADRIELKSEWLTKYQLRTFNLTENQKKIFDEYFAKRVVDNASFIVHLINAEKECKGKEE